jgi:hypothetical protein
MIKAGGAGCSTGFFCSDIVTIGMTSGRRPRARGYNCRMKRFLVPAAVAVLLLAPVARAEPDLSGIWMLRGLAQERELVMTEQALALQADYDLLEDDPSLFCEPASSSRVWANPNVRIAFDQQDDHVLISYEFYDLRRMIPLADSNPSTEPSTRNVNGTPFRKMGISHGRYEGDRLIIETDRHEAGYIRTSRGVPQSDNTRTVEVLWVDNDVLHLEQTYIDETLFEKPFVIDYEFIRLDETEMPLYECTDADYDWFEKLNAPEEDPR